MGELDILREQTETLPQSAEKMIVETQVGYANAAEFILSAKKFEKMIKDFFEPTIEQFKKAKSAAEQGRKEEVARMDKFLAPVLEAKNIVMQKCKDYENEIERKAQAEREEKIKEAKTAAEILEDPSLAAQKLEEATQIEPEINKVAGIGIRRVWHWKVKDINQIPKEYFMLDEVKINGAVRALKNETKIPGVEVYYE